MDKNQISGGASTTEEALLEQAPGFKFNPCAIDIINQYGSISSVNVELGWGDFKGTIGG